MNEDLLISIDQYGLQWNLFTLEMSRFDNYLATGNVLPDAMLV
jgi:hypothetical protein